MRVNRLQYADYEGEISHQTLPILDALVSCPKLERLVLFEEEGPNLPWGDEKLQDILFKFVSSMKHLVAFCFISASEYELGSVSELKRKFDEFIIPNRPAFWYHVDRDLPRANDPTVPRIHYDEIVCPINYLEVSPNL